MDKLSELNKIPVIESSCSGNELEYVLIANTEENQKALKALGVTQSDLEDMGSDDEDTLDITMFAFQRLGADGWQMKYGFLTLKQAKELNLEWADPDILEGEANE